MLRLELFELSSSLSFSSPIILVYASVEKVLTAELYISFICYIAWLQTLQETGKAAVNLKFTQSVMILSFLNKLHRNTVTLGESQETHIS